MLDETWQTIYERLWRSFVVLRQVVEDTNTSDHIEARNAVIQFCRYAFELRDWLLASDVDAAVKDAVSQLFGKPSHTPAKRVPAKSVALAACADIANESKHSVLDGPSYSKGGHAKVTYEHISTVHDLPEVFRGMIDDVPRFGDHQWMWLITVDGVEHDALLLAEDAIVTWEACLVGFGLVEPESTAGLNLAMPPQP
ncbi:hypothetical protein [Mycobacteroides abscessus]|uniref:hypothetical protein n=1 Tax=Mycobacteroides abscessus TaxID=36809 RepID=UPI0005E9CF18|nr:hypothetical protein [Mycobacteroides abscessus]UEA49535.1 hypothetical protein LK451_05005 [Mycobacteroides abscessus subsp. abscessus]UEA54658.1 hypothetical protein LK468_07595 [Mycobacteroides abscessus]CPR68928.1 Uncharacterised protein [Mycobacteroides abscessus]CPS36765.1 Uncharacterised protein [Mycobacteroides abscessus]CPY32432.1 Uncharacterised protein [Mycobacteroides abscessus]